VAVLLEHFARFGLTQLEQKLCSEPGGCCGVAEVRNFNVEKLAKSLRKMRSGF
jgi:hypothetical protein